MSRYFLLLIFFPLFIESLQAKSFMADAVVGILKNYYAEKSPKVDLIYYGKKFGYSETLCNEILRRKPHSVVMTVKSGENSWTRNLNISSILLFDSAENFNQNRISWLSNKHFRFKHLVVAPGINKNDMIRGYDGFEIDEVLFLGTLLDGTIFITTSFMYTPIACGVHQTHLTNIFNIKTLQWTKKRFFFVNKYRNIYKCPVRMFVEEHKKKTLGANIVNTYAKMMGSKVIEIFPRHLKQGFNTKYIDLYSSQTSWSIAFRNEKTSSYPYFIDHWVFFIPTGEHYSPLEKAMMPFQPEVWIAIFSTFAAFIIAIQLVKLTSSYNRELVFGSNIRTPTVNFISTFFTGVQLKVPTRNFSRFLLINCIFWCTIIRTCYQSELFKYLQSDMRKPEVQTILEMIQQNFTFLDNGFIMKFINETADSHGLQR